MSADPDADKPADQPEGEKADGEAPPEVEAEIVDAAFSDAVETPSAGAGASQPEKPSGWRRLTQRVPVNLLLPLILGLALVAGFLVWRILPPRPDRGPAPALEAAAPSETAQPAPPPADEAAEEGPVRPSPPDPSKISNAEAATAKTAVGEVDTAPVEGARGLPAAPTPAPDRIGGNDDLQRSAKEALRSLGETERSAPPTTEPPPIELKVEPEASASPPPAEDGFARLQEEAEARDLAQAAGELASAGAMRAPSGESAAAADKIGNDVEALRDLFRSETSRLSSELSAERSRSEGLARDVASLRESLNDAVAARDDLAGLKADIDKIRMGREEAASGKAVAASFALVALQQKLAGGAPYADELARLAGFAPGAAGLDSLSRHAADGVPTLGSLKTRFRPAIRKTLVADREARAKGFWGALAARLEGVISVRPATPQPGSSARAVISRAEARLAADDLAGAVGELHGLKGAAREAMGPWLEDAEARAGAEAALSSLSAALAGQFQN